MGREDYRREENMGEFAYNGNKYPSSTVEKYFREHSSGVDESGRRIKCHWSGNIGEKGKNGI